MELLIVLALAGAVVLLVAGPLRRGAADRAQAGESAARADLEAAKEVKYREIRDLELDFRTGKLTDAEYRAQDRALRAEAAVVLQRLDELGDDR